MTTFRVNKNANYSVINNQFLNDKKLSWKAKGILTWLLSRPDNWQIFLKDMQERSKDGRDSTAMGINELIDVGYIIRESIKNERNQFIGYNYQVFETENTVYGKPVYGKPETGNPETGKADTNKYLSNKVQKEINTKKYIPNNYQSNQPKVLDRCKEAFIDSETGILCGYVGDQNDPDYILALMCNQECKTPELINEQLTIWGSKLRYNDLKHYDVVEHSATKGRGMGIKRLLWSW